MKTQVSPKWPYPVPPDRGRVDDAQPEPPRRAPLKVEEFYLPPRPAMRPVRVLWEEDPPEHWDEEAIAAYNRSVGRSDGGIRKWAVRGAAAGVVGLLVAATYAAWRWWQRQKTSGVQVKEKKT